VVAGSLVWAVRLELHVLDHGGYALTRTASPESSCHEGKSPKPRKLCSLEPLECSAECAPLLISCLGCSSKVSLGCSLC